MHARMHARTHALCTHAAAAAAAAASSKVLEEMSSSLDSGPNATAAEAEMDAWAAPSPMPAKTLSGLAPPAGSDDLRV